MGATDCPLSGVLQPAADADKENRKEAIELGLIEPDPEPEPKPKSEPKAPEKTVAE